MAEKRPLCLYGGHVKQMQPGDTLLGAYNATEAGWIVNASGWLVATPGSTKTVDRTVCGSISPVTGGGIKVLNLDDNVVLKTADGTGVYIALGSANEPQNHLHMQMKGSIADYIQFTNDTTLHTSGDGFLVGLNASEEAVMHNQENSYMRFFTNALERMNITSGGDVEMNASFTVRGNASIDGNLVVGGTGQFANTVTITEDVQVDAGRYLYMDGGLDTYITASLDVMTMHVGTASMWALSEDGVAIGSPITAPAGAYDIGHFANKQDNSYIRITNASTGHTSGDGVVIGPTSLEKANFISYESDWDVWAQGSHIASLDSAGIIVADTLAVRTSGIQSRTGNLGITIQADGKIGIPNVASVDGNLYVGGDLDVTGSLRVQDEGHYIGDNTLGDTNLDTQKFIGNVIASGPFTIQDSGSAFIARGTASIDGDTTLASLWLTGNASINGNLVVGGTGAFGNTVTITEDVQVDAGRYLYLDGGQDSYLTATLDVMTFHVNSASTFEIHSTGVVVAGSVNASNTNVYGTLDVRDHTYLQSTASLGGNMYISALNNPSLYIHDQTNDCQIRFYAGDTQGWFGTFTNHEIAFGTNNSVRFTLNTNGDLIQSNGKYFQSDEIRALDSDGLDLLDDSGTYGINVRDGGNVYMGVNATVVGDLQVNGNASIGRTCTASDFKTSAGGRLAPCTLTTTGTITDYDGDDLMLNSVDDTSPDQSFIAEKVFNAVYNDVVDFQDIKEGEKVTYGKVYVDSYDGALVPTRRCQQGVMGICSDTFGFAVGRIQDRRQIPVSVSGWCLAYVDKLYDTGVPLTNTSTGCLTEMNASEKSAYPERLVAVFKRPETEEVWQGKVEVKGRHWVQVK